MNKTFTSSKGATIELRPVSQFKIDTLKASKAEIEAPTYTVPIVGGGSQEVLLDAVSAKNKDRLDEWNAYTEARAKAEADYAKKFLELMIWDGTEITVPNGDSEWHISNEHFGIKVPDDPIERKLFYVYNELLGTPEDIGNLIAEIFSVSSIDEEAVATLRNSFRANVQRKPNRTSPKGKKPMEGKQDIQSVGSDPLLEPTAP